MNLNAWMPVIGLSFIFACAGQKKNISLSTDQMIKEALGADTYVSVKNKTEEFLLCYTENKSQINNYGTVKYIVLEVVSNEVIIRGNIKDGYLNWVSEYEIEIIDVPGIAEEGKSIEDYKSVVNVKVQKH